ncbi:hypothetical protein [Streptomyces sp. CBG31]|uniref:hypothetical protein n=1 Tax=Streptomyces sp. CBG31 TaxID=2762623 RepID=UPI001EFD6E3F|nr:hypothetical protein [Streptomyces sp. CBG31]
MAVLPSLVTVAELAALLGRTFTPAQEMQAQALLDQASSVVRAYVRQDLTRATSTLTVAMRRADPVLHRCGGLVTLPQRPVVDIESVSVDGVSTQDWWQEGQEILLRAGSWSSPPTAHRPPQVAVTYTHGFDPIPGDIKAIVAQAANRVMVNPNAIRSETVGGESVTYLIPATGEALGVLLSRTEQRVLDRYRRTSGTVQVRGR